MKNKMSIEPTKKAPAIDATLKSVFGIDRIQSITKLLCVCCGASVDENSFKDALSKKEFAISGICQKCQDQIFNPPQ